MSTSLTLEYVTDPSSGIAIVRSSGAGLPVWRTSGTGTITYRCHTCGELIPKPWEVLFVDPVTRWTSPILPSPMPTTMTTHHDWHMQEGT